MKSIPFRFILVCAALTLINSTLQCKPVSKKITLDDLFLNYTFLPDMVSGLESMNDGLHYSVQEENMDITAYSYETGEKTDVIMPAQKLTEAGIHGYSSYSFSPDESKILLVTQREAIYRRSFTAEYYVYDRSAGVFSRLSENGKQQLATFSPDSKKIAFVRKNNLFIRDLVTGSEQQITSDGEVNRIINGAPDWVYEEEFEYNKAFEWSPDSKSIAWCRFDESRVPMFAMTMFKGSNPELAAYSLYPGIREWKYPKAGEDNSIVSVKVYNLAEKTTATMDVGTETDQYIPRIRWSKDSDNLCIFRLNRLQNKLELLMANRNTGQSKVFYTETNRYYLDETLFNSFSFLDNGNDMVFLSERDGWNHIYSCNIKDQTLHQITKGTWDVASLIGVDEANGLVYYQSAETSPLQRDIYAIGLNGENKRKLSQKEGTNEAEFSRNYRYFINTWSNASTPCLITLNRASGELIRVLEDNRRLVSLIKDYDVTYKQFFSFTTSQGVTLNGYMIKPPDFNRKKKYPVFMTQYSGPNSQSVSDSWEFGWENFLAQNGYIVVCVDGRGTGFRGEEFRKMTYLQLGKYETIDQIETAKYIGTVPFVDRNRIGIFGWSYGGFMVCSCLTRGADYFKMGIAVAPVTNWRYYDNIYTERFMRQPKDNPSGYDDNSPINHAGELKGHLLLVHGTGDDNVHFQNTMEFAEALVQAGKQFDMQIYTNRNHGIYGGYTRMHLYTRLFSYIQQSL